MMTRLLSVAPLLWCACTFVTLDDIEAAHGASKCNDAHPCVSGYVCSLDGLCVKSDIPGGNCTQGQTQACGSMVGECRQGTQSCQADNTFGPCMGGVSATTEVCDGKDNDCDNMTDEDLTFGGSCALTQGVCAGSHLVCEGGVPQTVCSAASYGADYEAGAETRCDGKDNDCDGMTDESLPAQPCSMQLGVCSGASSSCVGGSYAACNSALYSAHSGSYETFETRCDGLDNDCDGNVDEWAPVNLSNSLGQASRKPAATGTNAGNVVVLWEEGPKVATRVARLDGTLSAIIAPALTVENSSKSYSPAVASDGSVVVGLWGEESGATRRCQVATLDGTTGRSTLANQASLQCGTFTSLSETAVGVDATVGRVMVGYVDGSTLTLKTMPVALNMIDATTFTIPNAQHPTISAAGGGAFWVAYEDLSAGPVNSTAVRCFISLTGTKSCATTRPAGRTPSAFQATAGASAFSYYLASADAGVDRIASEVCDGGTCSTFPTVLSSVRRASMDNLRVSTLARGTAPALAAWDEGQPQNFRFVGANSDGGVRPDPGSANPGRRPQPVLLSNGRGVIVYDTEGSTSGSVTPDEVYLSRYCGL